MIDKSIGEMYLHDMVVSLHNGRPDNVKVYATMLLDYLKKPEHITPSLKRLEALSRDELVELLRHIVY